MPTRRTRVVFVPGLRTPGARRNDIAVFRILARQFLNRCDPPVRPEDLFLHVPGGGGSRPPRFVPYLRARRDPPAWGHRAPLDRSATGLAAALTTFTRTNPDRDVALVGYSTGGNAALVALGRLPDDVRDRIACVVTLAAPLRGLDRDVLAGTFGPPMLDRGIPWLLRAQDAIAPGLDCAWSAGRIVTDCATPVLNVAVEDDPVAPPPSALLGWPDTPPPRVEWIVVTPRRRRPERPWVSPADLAAALTLLGGIHAEVVLRRDVAAGVAKFVDLAGMARTP